MSDTHFWLQVLAQYGYAMVFAGTFVEGETVLILAGTLAHQGYFSLPLLALCAFAGSFASDQLMFFLGRHYGMALVRRRPALRRASAKVARLVGGHERLFMLGFRFICGIRDTAPLVLGAQGVDPRVFFALNALGAALWAVLFTGLGYGCGTAVEAFFGKLHAERHFWLALVMVCAFALSVVFWLRRWRKR